MQSPKKLAKGHGEEEYHRWDTLTKISSHVERHLDRTSMSYNPEVVGEDSRDEFEK